ncbi:MAG: hypothetical protein C5B59_07835 [Bacteroidetes bacterium]|nr:MAG: hypothetical protein C5B59_07835 [Bacteroidota bacterium]
MKSLIYHWPPKWLLFIFFAIFIVSGCRKQIDQLLVQNQTADNSAHGHLKQTQTFSSEVVVKWMAMELRLTQTATGANPFGYNPTRIFAYDGIALYESVVHGMPSFQTLSGQLTDFPAMPDTKPGVAYHWPTCANAALAFMNRHLSPNTSDANKASMDSLENALNTGYQSEVDADEFQRSVDYGRAVAEIVFDWSTTDGSATVYPPYVPPSGPGLWEPTPPGFVPAAFPHLSNNRYLVQGSIGGADPDPFPTYSTDPSSPYYALEREVYDISQSLTPDQIAQGLYYRDAPGYPVGGHYLSIVMQVLQQEQSGLDKAAITFAQAGITAYDALLGCWRIKYRDNIERPITYIRGVLGFTTWNALFNTPPHPDFPSGHSTEAGAFETILTHLFGENYHLTNHTYDYLGMPPQNYSSFSDMAAQIGNARVLAGIHTRYACTQGRLQGQRIAQNILNTLQFQKQ